MVAFITLKNVQVSRLFWDNKAAEVVERFTVNGSQVEKKYTLWFDDAQTLSQGSIVDVTGVLKAEIRQFQPQDKPEPVTYVQISVKKPKVTVVEGVAAGATLLQQTATEIFPDNGAPF